MGRRQSSAEKMALTWNPEGCRGKGRPKMPWVRTVIKQPTKEGQTWKKLSRYLARHKEFGPHKEIQETGLALRVRSAASTVNFFLELEEYGTVPRRNKF